MQGIKEKINVEADYVYPDIHALTVKMQQAFTIGFQSLLKVVDFNAAYIVEQDSDCCWRLIGWYGKEAHSSECALGDLPTKSRPSSNLEVSTVCHTTPTKVELAMIEHFAPLDSHSGVALRLNCEGGVVGLLLLYKDERNYFNHIDCSSICTHLSLFQIVLESKQAFVHATRQTDELQTLAAISVALRGAKTADEIAPIFLRKIVDTLNVKRSTIFRYNSAAEQLELWALHPVQRQVNLTVPLGEGFIGVAAKSDQPVFIRSQSCHSSLVQKSCSRSSPLPEEDDHLQLKDGALALAMATSQGQLVGVLSVHLSHRQHLMAEDISLLQAIATMAANVLNRASAMDTLEQMIAERTKELLIANEQLLELDRLKNKFIEDMSHEFRTPLTSIGLYLGLLEKEASEKSTKYIEALKRQTAQLSSLVNTILDISNPSRTGGLGEFETVELADITLDLFQTYEPYAEARNLVLHFDHNDPCLIQGNPEVLRRMISNLLDNAINYTSEGSIRISLCASESMAHLTISDTGLGIPREEIPLLFDRFYRGKQVGQLNIPGSGLGLSMVKQIVDQHNGQIDVASAVGQGSTFKICLPVVERAKVAQLAVA